MFLIWPEFICFRPCISTNAYQFQAMHYHHYTTKAAEGAVYITRWLAVRNSPSFDSQTTTFRRKVTQSFPVSLDALSIIHLQIFLGIREVWIFTHPHHPLLHIRNCQHNKQHLQHTFRNKSITSVHLFPQPRHLRCATITPTPTSAATLSASYKSSAQRVRRFSGSAVVDTRASLWLL